jgi:hypothetical protein
MPPGSDCALNGFWIEDSSEISMCNEGGNYSHFALLLSLTLLRAPTIELEPGPSHRATPY